MSATLVDPYPLSANKRIAVNTIRSRVSGGTADKVLNDRSSRKRGYNSLTLQAPNRHPHAHDWFYHARIIDFDSLSR